MSVLNLDRDKKNILILGLIVLVVYSSITFMDYSYNPAYDHLEYSNLQSARNYNCWQPDCVKNYHYTIEPWAEGIGIWPLNKMASHAYSEGTIPLWNPYLFFGYPNSAETANLMFSPMMIFYFLPDSYWDIPLLLSLWFTGIFTYYLLRIWKLNHPSSLFGSIIFMLSGTFTWYLPHDSILVIMFVPLILFSIEKIFQNKNFKYVIIGGFAFASSILGSHLESIVLVFLMILVYAIFRISYLTISSYTQKVTENSYEKTTQLIQSKKVVSLKIAAIFLAGIGISAFFILPSFEYLFETGNVIREDKMSGLVYKNVNYALTSIFVPYFLGSPIENIVDDTNHGAWFLMGGYVVASSMIFSIIAIMISGDKSEHHFQKRLAQFFLILSVFFILKSVGFPIINQIGTLPVLEHIVFPRYSGFIIILGLVVSSSIGFNFITQNPIKIKNLGIVTLVSLLVVILLSLFIIPVFPPDNNFVKFYVLSQILLAVFFILMAFFFVISCQRNKFDFIPFLFLVFLEASVYVPLGLPPIWQFYRSLVVVSGVSFICLTNFLFFHGPSKFSLNKKNQLVILIVIAIITVVGQQIIFLESPAKLPIRNEIFQESEVTSFIKNNLGNSRIISFNYALRPNYPAAYQIQAVGIISSMNLKTTNSFAKILDPFTQETYLNSPKGDTNFPAFEYTFIQNKKFYDFVGTKYVISFSSDPNMPQNFWGPTKPIPLSPSEDRVNQKITLTKNSVSELAIWMGNHQNAKTGEIFLEINSIPFEKNFHRISKINAENVPGKGFVVFQFDPISDVNGKEFEIKLYYPEARRGNNAAFFTVDLNQRQQDDDGLTEENLFINGKSSGKFIPMTIPSENFELIYNNRVKIYENKDVFPRAFLVNKYRIADSFESAQNILQKPDFDLRNEIVLEKNLDKEKENQLKLSNLDADSFAVIKSHSFNEVLIETKSDSASLLVLTDSHNPGWHAYIDGEETDVFRANGFVRAVFVPDGLHTIKFTYLPLPFLIGAIISIITIVILFSIYFLKVFLKQKPKRIQ